MTLFEPQLPFVGHVLNSLQTARTVSSDEVWHRTTMLRLRREFIESIVAIDAELVNARLRASDTGATSNASAPNLQELKQSLPVLKGLHVYYVEKQHGHYNASNAEDSFEFFGTRIGAYIFVSLPDPNLSSGSVLDDLLLCDPARGRLSDSLPRVALVELELAVAEDIPELPEIPHARNIELRLRQSEDGRRPSVAPRLYPGQHSQLNPSTYSTWNLVAACEELPGDPFLGRTPSSDSWMFQFPERSFTGAWLNYRGVSSNAQIANPELPDDLRNTLPPGSPSRSVKHRRDANVIQHFSQAIGLVARSCQCVTPYSFQRRASSASVLAPPRSNRSSIHAEQPADATAPDRALPSPARSPIRANSALLNAEFIDGVHVLRQASVENLEVLIRGYCSLLSSGLSVESLPLVFEHCKAFSLVVSSLPRVFRSQTSPRRDAVSPSGGQFALPSPVSTHRLSDVLKTHRRETLLEGLRHLITCAMLSMDPTTVIRNLDQSVPISLSRFAPESCSREATKHLALLASRASFLHAHMHRGKSSDGSKFSHFSSRVFTLPCFTSRSSAPEASSEHSANGKIIVCRCVESRRHNEETMDEMTVEVFVEVFVLPSKVGGVDAAFPEETSARTLLDWSMMVRIPSIANEDGRRASIEIHGTILPTMPQENTAPDGVANDENGDGGGGVPTTWEEEAEEVQQESVGDNDSWAHISHRASFSRQEENVRCLLDRSLLGRMHSHLGLSAYSVDDSQPTLGVLLDLGGSSLCRFDLTHPVPAEDLLDVWGMQGNGGSEASIFVYG
jgi:hypothetical protein